MNRKKLDISSDIINLVKTLVPIEGYNSTSLPTLRLLKISRSLSVTPVLYEPGIVIVCQGKKVGYLGRQQYCYDENHYLAVNTPVPFTMQTWATNEDPLLAIYLQLDFALAYEVMLGLDGPDTLTDTNSITPMTSTPMDFKMQLSIIRLLHCLSDPTETKMFGNSCLKEIYYRVLSGPQGVGLRKALTSNSLHHRIGAAISWIHTHHQKTLRVSELAALCHMSSPTFHFHFQQITGTSPLQYAKTIRLHRARLLMVQENETALSASIKVGYESPSQFNREFKRLFSLPPKEEAKRLKNSYGLAPTKNSEYVTSH